MCGITGIISKEGINKNLNEDLYESMLNIQHRGQDACGYVINNDNNMEIFKGTGLVKNAIDLNKLINIDDKYICNNIAYSSCGAMDYYCDFYLSLTTIFQ